MKYVHLYFYLTFFLILSLTTTTKGQEPNTARKVTGIIINSETELPVIGASVFLERTDNGTKSDSTGFFKIYVPENTHRINITCIGYNPSNATVSGDNTAVLKVRLQPKISGLKEIVVNVNTGYQKIPRERATGSFGFVNNEDLNVKTGSDVISRIEDMTTSVLFDKRGGTNNIQIRGLSTLDNSRSKPLIVVDKFPFQGEISDLNPNDVESITVLKDAAASSIWGVAAGNAVIVITTKKGKFNQPFKLSFNSNFTTVNKPDVFYKKQMKASDFIDVETWLFKQGYYDTDLQNTNDRPPVSPVVELLNKVRDNLISQSDAETAINKFKNADVRNDYERYLYRKGNLQQYSLELTGGAQRLNYLISLGYDKSNDLLVGNQYERITARTSASFKPMKNLDIEANIIYTQDNAKNNSIGSDLNVGGGKSIYPYAQIAGPDGSALAIPKYYRKSYVDTAGGGRLVDWNYRPLDEMKFADNKSTTRHLVFSLSGTYHIVKNVSAEISYQHENQDLNVNNNLGLNTFYTRDLINLYTSFDNDLTVHNVPVQGILDRNTNNLVNNSIRLQFGYNNNFKKSSSLTALAGGEIRQTEVNINSSRIYGYNDRILSFSDVDYSTLFPTYDNLKGNLKIPSATGISSLLNRFISLFGNAAYTYKNRYTLSASARKDASNLFGVNSNQKWVPLWSVGASWIINEEKFGFLKSLSLLRLRSSYGTSGNVDNTISALTTLSYGLFPSTITNLPYTVVQNPPNPSLRWEKVKTFNIGLDAASRNNRVSGTIELFNKAASDLIDFVPADFTTGVRDLRINSSSINTKGLDLTVNAKIIDSKFKWGTTFLFSYARSKVTKALYNQNNLTSYVGFGTNILPLEGYAPYSIVSYRFGGLDAQTGDPIGFLGGKESKDYAEITQKATKEDLVFHGSAIPLYFGAFRNDFSYANFTLLVNISYKFDYWFRHQTINYSSLYSSWDSHDDYTKRWQKPGDETKTTVPSMTYPGDYNRDKFYANSSATVLKGNNIRIKDIRIQYQFQHAVIGNSPIKSLVVYSNVSNVGIIWRANDLRLDPDYFSTLPTPVSFTIGLRASF